MRALRFERYGAADVLHVADVDEPVPGVGQVKVRVHAASLNPLDWKIRAGHLKLLPAGRPPRGLGCDFAGTIVGVGGGAQARHPGERVFGSVSPFARNGSFAEYVVVRHDAITPMPDDVEFAVAAALPVAAGTALQALVDHGRIHAGQRVLVTGAAGGVGHCAIQVAAHFGAFVVGVCGTRNVEFVRALGADEVIDYTRDDFTRRADRFDVVFDAASSSSFRAARAVLAADGLYISTAGSMAAVAGTVLGGILGRLTSRQRALPFTLKTGASQWQRLAALVAAGALRPHIEREVTLAEAPAALGAMESGHGRGKTVVRL
jgi:NADPH:quinone reductase-like Zn-dependent oxidoreductase